MASQSIGAAFLQMSDATLLGCAEAEGTGALDAASPEGAEAEKVSAGHPGFAGV